jgi:hypothetical protein
MPKKLLIINAILVTIAAGSVVFIARQLMAPMPMPLPTRGRPAPATPTTAGTPESARLPGAAYDVVASKNLFSPSRAEAPVSAITANAPPVAKPNLFGVVLREGSPVAYLEDPASKRVSGYRVGDSVAGGTVQTINADSVVITRPDGKLDVRLRDPGKPRPATAATPGAQPVANMPLPGVIPPPTAPPSAAAPVPAQPGIQQPGQPGQPVPVIPPGRRPLPPNLLRRLPQTPTADAPQR